MNHHHFRQFIQRLSSEVIRIFNINPAHFKTVCFVLSMYGDYETGSNIRPSWLTVAKEAGVNRKTAMKVRDVLLDQGILKLKRKNESNISVYDFEYPNELSIFDEQLSKMNEQLSSIDGHNITKDITKDTTNLIKIKEELQKESVVQNTTFEVKHSMDEQSFWLGNPGSNEYNKTPVVHFEQEEDGYDERFDYPDSVVQNAGVEEKIDISTIANKIESMLNKPFTFERI
jgi:DNA-binding transcriptional regulator YhcF (GntR family)